MDSSPAPALRRVHPDVSDVVNLADAYRLEPTRPPASTRPRVGSCMITSLDGSVTIDGSSGRLGNANDRAILLALREQADVVIVGAGTARGEGYGAPRAGDDDWARALTVGELASEFYDSAGATYDEDAFPSTHPSIAPRLIDAARPAGFRVLISTDPITAPAVSGTDYAPAAPGTTNLLAGNGSGGFSAVSVTSPLTFSSNTLGITQATAAQSGYLSSTDWNTFNDKISSTSLSATSPLAYDSATGIFSLGTVLYEMLTGRRAFARETAAETMTAILREDPEDIASSAAHVPISLVSIVRRCLEKQPSERFQSASDLAFSLQAQPEVSTPSLKGVAATGGTARRCSGFAPRT